MPLLVTPLSNTPFVTPQSESDDEETASFEAKDENGADGEDAAARNVSAPETDWVAAKDGAGGEDAAVGNDGAPETDWVAVRDGAKGKDGAAGNVVDAWKDGAVTVFDVDGGARDVTAAADSDWFTSKDEAPGTDEAPLSKDGISSGCAG